MAEIRDGPGGLASLAVAVTHGDDDAEQRLVDLMVRRIPDLVERIRTLTAWAGVTARENSMFWFESLPQRLLLAESTEAILDALMVAPALIYARRVISCWVNTGRLRRTSAWPCHSVTVPNAADEDAAVVSTTIGRGPLARSGSRDRRRRRMRAGRDG